MGRYDCWPLKHRPRWEPPAEEIDADIDKSDPTRCPCGRRASTSVVTPSGLWPMCSGCVKVFQRYDSLGIEVIHNDGRQGGDA